MQLSDPFGRQAATEMCLEWWNRGKDDVWLQSFVAAAEGGAGAGTGKGKDPKNRQTAEATSWVPLTLLVGWCGLQPALKALDLRA
jgi:hypothetical protein